MNTMRQPTLRLACTLTGRGWVEASLSDGSHELTLTASYLSDALSDLLWIVISLVEGAQEGTCAWQQEPGEYRWLFSRQEEQIEIRLLWFSETFSQRPDEEGECHLLLTCSLLKFATKIQRQYKHLLSTWGDAGYRETWGYPFPHIELLKLKHLLARAQQLSKNAGTLPESE